MKGKDRWHSLTTAQQAVCEAALQGLRVKEIAKRLGKAPKTVRNQLSDAYSKLEVDGIEQLRKEYAARAPRPTRPERHGLDESKLFNAPADGKARLDEELRGRSSCWWKELGDSRGWFGHLFTYWVKTVTFPPETFRYELDPSVELTSATFGWGADRPSDKAVLVEVSGMLTDEEHVVHLRRGNFGMSESLRGETEHHDEVSFFCVDIPGRLQAPSNMAVHATVVTSDGYVLLGRRSSAVSWYQHAWSATFEEQIELWPKAHRATDQPDETVGDTFHRGLRQELHHDAVESFIEKETCTAIGLHWDWDFAERIMDPGILVAARLSADVDQVWEWISERHRAADAAEAEAWIAVPFRSLDEAAALLDVQRAGVADLEDLKGVREHNANPQAHRNARWHPTSRGRLFLAAEWLELR